MNSVDGPGARAPGADDNASGSAGVIALAEAMAGYEFESDLEFVLFGGEEQGLFGSRQYVASLDAAARSRIEAVLNMDMIGHINSTPQSVLLEGADISEGVIADLTVAAQRFTTLAVQTSLSPFASDHVPFLNAGIPAVLTIEGTDSANDQIHTSGDTRDRVDVGFAMQILRMNAGWLAARAKLHPDPDLPVASPTPAAPVTGAVHGDCECHRNPNLTDRQVLEVNLFKFHCQALFAQYLRLLCVSGLARMDMAQWQRIRDDLEQIERLLSRER